MNVPSPDNLADLVTGNPVISGASRYRPTGFPGGISGGFGVCDGGNAVLVVANFEIHADKSGAVQNLRLLHNGLSGLADGGGPPLDGIIDRIW
jgi:hypothetical protein